MENVRIVIDNKTTDFDELSPSIIFRNPEEAIEFIESYFDVIVFIGVEESFWNKEFVQKIKDALSYKRVYHPATEVFPYHAETKTVQDISADVDGWDEQTDSIETPQELG